ncbi:hypothetical protein ADJ73_11045 [Arsenicicoccus sp. oral taxon 190]|nr:hypothetical protein ADJ73_11045 [Arsenicicoccus sp. oral taxon 190]
MTTDLLAWQIPPVEKVIRTVVVYLGIALIVRLAGKRLMAQMNSLDLVVVLLLSNVVQNAIIGDDNSLSGGLLGAAVLVAFNALLERLADTVPWVRWLLEGRPTELIHEGVVDEAALRRLGITELELLNAIHSQGADHTSEVLRARVEPGGNVTVLLKRADQAASYGDLQQAVATLQSSLDELQEGLERQSSGKSPST